MRLTVGSASAEFDPNRGGRLASLMIDGVELLVQPEDLGATPGLDGTIHQLDPMAWGGYPMVPWAGRVNRGLFSFDDTAHELPIGLAPHAIHGTAYLQQWELDEATEFEANTNSGLAADRPIQTGTASGSMSVNLDRSWPLGGRVTHSAELSERSLILTLSVTAQDHAMPVMVGWHPWFRRVLTPGKPEAQLEWHPGRMYELDTQSIPTGELGPIPEGPWDNCFVDLTSEPNIIWPNQIELTLSSDCQCWVVYTEPTHALCVEPQSDAPDSFNRDPDRLEPGETFRRTFALRW